MLDLADPANRRVVDYFAARNQGRKPLEEAAYYPPIRLLTTLAGRGLAAAEGGRPLGRGRALPAERGRPGGRLRVG